MVDARTGPDDPWAMARRPLARQEQKRRFLERYGHALSTLPSRPSYRQVVLTRPNRAPARGGAERADAQRCGALAKVFREWVADWKPTGEKADAIGDFIRYFEAIARAGDTQAPNGLSEEQRRMAGVDPVGAALARGARDEHSPIRDAKPPCLPAIEHWALEWIEVSRALGAKNILRRIRRGLETGVQRGYSPEEFDLLTRVREATETQIIQRGRGLAARHLRVPVDRIVFLDGRFFGGTASPRNGIPVEWARSRMTTIRWKQIQRHVSSSYLPEGVPPLLGHVLSGTVENFTRWLVRHGDGLLEELPDRLPRSCRTTEEGLALRRRQPRRHRSDLDMRLPLAVFLLSRARPGSSAGSGPWSTWRGWES